MLRSQDMWLRLRTCPVIALAALVFWATVLPVGRIQAAEPVDFPTRPIRLVVPFPPGGFPDTMARLFGQHIGKELNQTIIVENKPSAGSIVAAETVVRSAPDGYTLLVCDLQVWAINATVYKNLNFDVARDLEPVSIMGTTPMFMLMSTTLPSSNNLKEVIALLKANPKKYNYGSVGIGSLHHLSMSMFLAQTGIEMTHVVYKGSNVMLPALASGEVALGFQSLAAAPTFLKQGTIKLVAAAIKSRSSAAPEVPTFAELGVDEMIFPGSLGFLAPRGTPPAVVEKLVSAVQKAIKSPELIERLNALGIEPVGNTPREFLAWMQADVERVAKAAKFAKIDPQ